MFGCNLRKVTKKKIQEAFDRPIVTSRILELACRKKGVFIIFDHLSRPTEIPELVAYLLKEGE